MFFVQIKGYFVGTISRCFMHISKKVFSVAVVSAFAAVMSACSGDVVDSTSVEEVEPVAGIVDSTATDSTGDVVSSSEDKASSDSKAASSSSKARDKATVKDDLAKKLVERMGTGINLGNIFEAPNENFSKFDENKFKSNWSETLTPDEFKALADSGFTNVRIPVSWEEHVTGDGEACVVDPEWMNQVFWAVDNAVKNGLIVVVNAHHWDKMYSSPETETPCLLSVYRQIAERAKTYSADSLIVETLNEPRDKLTSPLWNKLVASIISEVRAVDPNRVMMVGTWSYNASNTTGLMELPAGEKNLIATFHYYEPMSFTHQGNDFTFEKYPTGVEWRATANQQRVVRNAFTKFKDWADKHDMPVYLGEYGTYEAVDTLSREYYTTFVNGVARSLGFATAYWELSSSFGVYDENTKKWKSYLMRALLHPSLDIDVATHTSLDSMKYVLLDDFDSKNDPVNLTSLSAKISKARGDSVAPGTWYAYCINTSQMFIDGGDTLITGSKNTNFDRMITKNGHDGKGLYVKIHLEGETYPWAGIGTTIDGENRINFKNLKALSFWAKGKGEIKVAWSTDFADTCCVENWGVFSYEFDLTPEWKQYTIWWDDWTASAWSELAALGAEWVDHNDDVTKLQFSNGSSYGMVVNEDIEFYLDDIRFYGMDDSDFGIKPGK